MERDLLSLPSRLGGIALINPSTLLNSEYSASKNHLTPILRQNTKYKHEADVEQFRKIEGTLHVTSSWVSVGHPPEIYANHTSNMPWNFLGGGGGGGSSNWLIVLLR